jgi:uncharacterized SAM-dependent methyltransferase
VGNAAAQNRRRLDTLVGSSLGNLLDSLAAGLFECVFQPLELVDVLVAGVSR